MLSNLFIFLVTLWTSKEVVYANLLKVTHARMQWWLRAYLHGEERRDYEVLRERERDRERVLLCVCVCLCVCVRGRVPLQFKPHCGSLYKSSTDNVQHCVYVRSLGVICRRFKGTCWV
jgi:hypothetical protein